MASVKSNSVADAKEHLAELDGRHDGTPVLPDSLVGVSEDEMKKIERRAILKLDFIIMPAITILYILNYLDRQNLAASKLAGIMEDLDMTVQQFNTCISILFVGYSKPPQRRTPMFSQYIDSADDFHPVLMQVPSNLLVSKIAYPMWYINAAVFVWGAISACTAAVQSFGGLIACRFMLGFVS